MLQHKCFVSLLGMKNQKVSKNEWYGDANTKDSERKCVRLVLRYRLRYHNQRALMLAKS
jgi:hypothetical protein